MDAKTLTVSDIDRLAEQLEGSCTSLDSILDEEFGLALSDIPVNLLSLLDEKVMECQQCGWWSDSSTFDDNQICGECNGDE